jgi:hypothetical protein
LKQSLEKQNSYLEFFNIVKKFFYTFLAILLVLVSKGSSFGIDIIDVELAKIEWIKRYFRSFNSKVEIK